MYYILGWKSEVNAQDNTGSTSLHIAVKFAESFGDLRSIKELLMKGADRHLKDNEGNQPIDFVDKHVSNEDTQQILRILLVRLPTFITTILGLTKNALYWSSSSIWSKATISEARTE